jgi:hypothetical protein
MKPLIGAGVAAAAALTWVFAFRTGWSSSEDWNEEWNNPADTRGKGVYIANKAVETAVEKEQRLAKERALRGELGAVKRSIIGDSKKTRGSDIIPETPPPPPGFDFNARDACLQMKMEYPERYGSVDCMSDRYDTLDPWWETGRAGH